MMNEILDGIYEVEGSHKWAKATHLKIHPHDYHSLRIELGKTHGYIGTDTALKRITGLELWITQDQKKGVITILGNGYGKNAIRKIAESEQKECE